MQKVWVKIYVAAVAALCVSVIALIISGEKKPVFWLVTAVVSIAAWGAARLKIKTERK